jgi:vacuolar-type H+-ATPase subunit H
MKKYKSYVNRTAPLVQRDETIRELKKENKNLSRAIKEIEEEKKVDIASLLTDKKQIISGLETRINQLEEELAESKKKSGINFSL